MVTGKARPRLISSTFWNIAGQGLPLLVGILTLPALIRLIGLERFSFITLVWVLVGYASVFDFGISRALIRVVAANLADGDEARARSSANAGLLFVGLFGVLIGVAVALARDWLLQSVLKLPAWLLPEARPAMYLLACSLPFVMLTTGYIGLLSAYQRFKALNLIKLAMGVASYLGPLAVAFQYNSLQAIVGFVLALRLMGTVAYAWISRTECGFRMSAELPQRAVSRELFTLGGWMSVSNIVGPMLSYLDRLLLSALVPLRTVAFYATPFDLISKIMILPYSVMAAVFPRASAAAPGTDKARQVFKDAMRIIFVVMFPALFAVVVVARPGLESWLGTEFSQQAAPVLQILAIGVLFNALAQGPATLIQAAGQPRLMAQLHLVELPLFLGLVWWLTSRYGIVGTAVASALRNCVDAVGVLVLARRGAISGSLSFKPAVVPGILAMSLFAAALWPTTWVQSLLVLAIGGVGFSGYSWFYILMPDERQRVIAVINRHP